MTEIRLLPSHDETSSVRVLVIDDRSILALDVMVDADFYFALQLELELEEVGGAGRRRRREKRYVKYLIST